MPALLPLLLLLLTAGCAEGGGALLAADAATVAVFGRGIGDVAVSAVTGNDCSIVRLERGQPYCAPRYVPLREAYCTRSLAAVDCWATPPPRPTVADTPSPTPAQVRYREAPWPKSLRAGP